MEELEASIPRSPGAANFTGVNGMSLRLLQQISRMPPMAPTGPSWG